MSQVNKLDHCDEHLIRMFTTRGERRQPWCEDWQIDSLDQTGQRCLCSPLGASERFTHFGKLFVGSQDNPKFESFGRQAVIGMQADHASLCSPVGGCLEADLPVLVFERLTSLTLSEWREQESGSQPASARISVAMQVASGLVAVHKSGFVHGNLRSEHVLVAADGGVQIVGWGQCQVVGDHQRGAASLSGTMHEMLPPEMLAPEYEVSSAQDVYALAFMLSDLLGENFLGSKLACSLQSDDPVDRPTAAELLALLREVSIAIGAPHASPLRRAA